MKKQDPDIVLDSLTESKKQVSSLNVYPITITRYAWLEKVHSPFIDTSIKFELNTVIPSIFICCSEKAALKKYSSQDAEALISDSFDWADENLEIEDLGKAVEAVLGLLAKINKAAPNAAKDDVTKKKQ